MIDEHNCKKADFKCSNVRMLGYATLQIRALDEYCNMNAVAKDTQKRAMLNMKCDCAVDICLDMSFCDIIL